MNSRAWNSFDVIVIGGGHAGIEAAYAAARMGCRTLLVTLSRDRIGWMPCNPAVGGIGKGHIVFEISALGGLMPQLCTQTYLQARMLNTSKGPAVQGLRLQIDKFAYNKAAISTLEATPNLTIIMSMVEEVLLDGTGTASGVRTREGATYSAPTVVITGGTFQNGLIHIGQTHYTAGRQGEEASVGLPRWLKTLQLRMGRLKTGTPPRLLRSSLNFSVMEVQGSDALESLFEYGPHQVTHKVDCHITHTNEHTHEVIRKNAHLSPIYTGNITGKPPRYCPSIEDKISRFAGKTSHHVFVEPEGATSEEIYPNGLSTSLPLEAQREFIQTIAGFENAVITRPGYAIEYDFIEPNQLNHTLELKTVPGLFFAGQINGTTGYEEAAGQGLIAGINAAAQALGKPSYVMHRNQGYIGIMIDDLVTLGVDEPYRMFTSRAERRLIVRQDSVFSRLADEAFAYNLIDQTRYDAIKAEDAAIKTALNELAQEKKTLDITRKLSAGESTEVQQYLAERFTHLSDRARTTLYAELLYGPYLKRELREIEKMEEFRELRIPDQLDYGSIEGLSVELKQKLSRIRPKTIEQTSLIQGMTPAAISLLIFVVRTYTGPVSCEQSVC